MLDGVSLHRKRMKEINAPSYSSLYFHVLVRRPDPSARTTRVDGSGHDGRAGTGSKRLLCVGGSELRSLPRALRRRA